MGRPVFPPEILAEIIQWMAVDKVPLSHIALANSVCWHHVRTARFTEVRLNHHHRSIKLVALLLMELLRLRAARPAFPTVGELIRKVTVNMLPGSSIPICCTEHDLQPWLTQFHAVTGGQPLEWQLESDVSEAADFSLLLPLSTEERNVDGEMRQKRTSTFLAHIVVVLRLAMPNLKALDWDTGCWGMEAELWPALTKCFYRLDHLSLHMPAQEWLKAKIDPKSLKLRHPILHCEYEAQEGPHANLDPTFATEPEGKTAQKRCFREIIPAILEACAPRLRTLELGLSHIRPVGGQEAPNAANFPELETLRIRSLGVVKNFRAALVNSPHVRFLQVNYDSGAPLMDAVDKLPHLQSLDLTWGWSRHDPEAIADALRFLDGHRDIKFLRIGECTPAHLDEKIIPFLSTGALSSLTSLDLGCDFLPVEEVEYTSSPKIITGEPAPASLTAIGQLVTLKHLKIAVTSRIVDFKCEWVVDHAAMRRALSGLQKLELLALEGDSWVDRFDRETYYNWRLSDRVSIVVLSDEVGGGMFGPYRDMVDLRARHYLDWEDEVDSQDQQIWQPADEDTGVDPNRQIGPVCDRYCDVDQGRYFHIIKRNCALAEAEGYAVLPRLRTMYLGEVLAKIVVPGSGLYGNAVPLVPNELWRDFPEEIFDMGHGVKQPPLNEFVQEMEAYTHGEGVEE